MKLYEYQAMELFRDYGINTPETVLIESPQEAFNTAKNFKTKVVIKAQVLTGGRGKAGGIKVADSPLAAQEKYEEISKLKIKTFPVEKILLAKAVDIAKEYYLGITIDRANKAIVLMISASGGVDIEEVASQTPDKIFKLSINPLKGLEQKALEGVVSSVFEERSQVVQVVKILNKMYKLFIENDCSLVEINPFCLTKSGDCLALDGKVIFDDNALFKHPDKEELSNPEEYSSDEIKARESGLSFVSLDGDIGCIVNGAGLAMATLDIIKLFGGDPANFLDVGGSSNPNKVLKALEIILSNKKVKAILINIFGGITRCDDIAKGIIIASEQIEIKVPLVIRLIGTNDTQGRKLLKDKGFEVYEAMSEAVKKVVAVG